MARPATHSQREADRAARGFVLRPSWSSIKTPQDGTAGRKNRHTCSLDVAGLFLGTACYP
jgi:hypothetical protein